MTRLDVGFGFAGVTLSFRTKKEEGECCFSTCVGLEKETISLMMDYEMNGSRHLFLQSCVKYWLSMELTVGFG